MATPQVILGRSNFGLHTRHGRSGIVRDIEIATGGIIALWRWWGASGIDR
jgi:hypothetical protein